MLYIPIKTDEIFPEFRFTFTICFPGEGNYYTVVISLKDIDRIKACDKWIPVADHVFNKDKAEAFRFDTEILLRDKWVSYTPEKAEEALKEELQAEMLKGSQLHDYNIGVMTGHGDLIGVSSIEKIFKTLISNQNKEKTGR
jgi:hypothetical protein